MAIALIGLSSLRCEIDSAWSGQIKSKGFQYRDLLLPRSYITIFSAVVVGIGGLESTPKVWLAISGGGMFMLSHLYAMSVIWRFSRRG